MARKVKITAVSDVTRLWPNGTTYRVKLITFNIGEFGPFTKEVDPANFTPDQVSQLVEQEATAIDEMVDKLEEEE